MKYPIENKTVAIVGGGPGGLTLARILQMNGVDVKVYERDITRTARVQGATLNLNEESGLLALHKANLMEQFKAAYRPGAEKMAFVDKNANVVIEDFGGGNLQEERPEIDRGPLRELLLDSLQEGTVTWYCQFDSLERVDGQVKLNFKNGQSHTADVVVAADGANSKIRPYITPLKPAYSGVTIVEGTIYDVESAIPRLHQLLDGGKICVLSDSKTLFIVLKGDGSAAFYSGHKADESWARDSGIDFSDNAQVVQWFKSEFEGWDEMWIELFEKAASFVVRPQYCAPLDQTWEALPDLTMLGDSAHVMPPYAGEGVNMAMQDALELAECLLSTDIADTRSAIAAYEESMRARVAEVGATTMEFTDIFHSPDAISHFVEFFKTHVN
ncbi:FAD-dependent monooxygenase [bacterium]|nr:MAG: FAD-dependent monooxygenase [bacterium]